MEKLIIPKDIHLAIVGYIYAMQMTCSHYFLSIPKLFGTAAKLHNDAILISKQISFFFLSSKSRKSIHKKHTLKNSAKKDYVNSLSAASSHYNSFQNMNHD